MNSKKHTSSSLRTLLKERRGRSAMVVYFVLRILVLAVMLRQFFNGNFENFFLCILTLFLFTLPSFIERKLAEALPAT